MSEYQSLLDRYEQLKQHLEINKHELHEMLVQQPALNHDVGEAWANAANFRDEAELRAEMLEASFANKYHEEALSYQDPKLKPTEYKLKYMVAATPQVIEAKKNYLQWKHLANLWYKLTESFGQRPAAIEGLSRLYLANYYRRESITRAEAEHQNVVAEQVRTAQAAQRSPLIHSRDQTNAADAKQQRPTQVRLSRG